MRGSKPVYLQTDTFGVFPNYSRPQVLWLGLNEYIERLEILQKNIYMEGFSGRTGCSKLIPHLTCCRIKYRSGIYRTGVLVKLLDSVIELNAVEFHTSEITIIKSCITNPGPIYDLLGTLKIRMCPNVET